jgi:hypothetical protein
MRGKARGSAEGAGKALEGKPTDPMVFLKDLLNSLPCGKT